MIDSRVVEMKFNNSQFLNGVRTTLSALDSLRKGLRLDGAAKGINDVTAAGKRFNLNPMASAAGLVSSRFSALQVVGVTALATIANQAVTAGQRMVSSLSLDPIMEGFREYETKLGSIQTILANTQASGATLQDVNGTLKELNHYSDQTIYNFAEMAKNIGTFTAAGVDLQTSTASIKGIANLAALSGSNSQQASTAMYQLSQAISAGRVSLMDWNSVVNAGMGGTVFQRALAETAVAMGTIEKGALKLEGPMKNVTISGKSFRESLTAKPGQESWLTSDVLTTALGTFTGDMNEAELAAIGFTEAQVQSIMQTAQTAKEAATVVKSGTQLIGTLQEAAASGWSETWEIIIGDFEEAKQLWTGVSNVFGGMISASAEARNHILTEWKSLGGRDMLIAGISNAFKALMAILTPIKQAFRDIFPAKTGADLAKLTDRFRDFTERLIIGGETAENLRRTFRGVFAVFSIIGQILSAAAGMVGRFFGAISEGSGGFLEFTGGIGDFLVSLDQMLKKSGVVEGFFTSLGNILSDVFDTIKRVGTAVASLFDGFAGFSGGVFEDVVKRFEPLTTIGEKLREVFSGLGKIISNAATKIGEALRPVGDLIASAFSSDNFSKTLDVVNTGLLAGILFAIKNFFSGAMGNLDVSGGLFDSIKDTLGSVTDALNNLQTQIKADILMKIALALGILTASIVALSLIDPEKLAVGLGGLAAGFVGLNVALMALSASVGIWGTLKLPLLVVSMVGLAAALLLMAGAMKIMASIDGESIGRALIGLGGSLLIIATAMRIMPKNMVGQAAALIILAGALAAIALAVKLFATISWDDMAHGLSALAGSLLILAAAMRLMPTNMIAQAAGLVILAGALAGIALAVKLFATINWDEMTRGLVALGGSLLLIAAGLRLMPANMLAQSAGLVAVSIALNLVALAVKSMGGMSWEEIGKGLITLGGALLVLGTGLIMMSGTLSGAAALAVAAGALMLLTPVLITLGSLSWGTIITGLIALGATFTVLGVAGLLLTPLVPVLIGLGGAIVLLGTGLAAAGVAAVAFATAFTMVIAAGSAGVAIFANLIKVFIESIPAAFGAVGAGIVILIKTVGDAAVEIGKAFSKLLSELLNAIVKNAPKFKDAFVSIMNSLLDAVIQITPKIGQALNVLIAVGLNVLVTNIPRFVSAGMQILLGFLQGINNNISRIIPVAISIIVNFINGVAQGLPRVIQAGVNLVISFVNGVANAIRNNSAAMGAAGANLATAIVSGMARGLAAGVGTIARKAADVARSALNAAKSVLGIASPSKEFEKIGEYVNEGFIKGLTGNESEIDSAFDKMTGYLKDVMDSSTAEIERLEGSLKELNEAKEKDIEKIKETTAALANARAELSRSNSAHVLLTKSFKTEQGQLKKLAAEHEALGESIRTATSEYEDAKRARDDYAKSTANQYSNLPDITNSTRLVRYIEKLETQIQDTAEFTKAVDRLRDLGLNDTMYRELITKGLDTAPFVEQLLAGGPTAIKQINKLSSQLSLTAEKLGAMSSKELYQAGVDAAQGLINGLMSKEAKLLEKMEKLADGMVRVLKRRLKIESPSRVFAELGEWSVEGLAKGLRQTSLVSDAAGNLGDEAMVSLRKSLSGLSNAIGGELDMNPVISPILDLSDVKRNAAQLDKVLGTRTVDANFSYGQASTISRTNREVAQAQVSDSPAAPAESTVVQFVQNNHSPKALSSVEIFRNTRNQLSLAREALKA